MAKLATIFATASAASAVVASGSVKDQFEDFITRFHKTYSSTEEKQARFKVFLDNVARIAELTISNPEIEFGINQFADLTDAEREHIFMTGFRSGLPAGLQARPIGDGAVDPAKKGIDYADKCWDVVRDQGQCGSCWAFSTAAAVEGAYCKKYDQKIELLSTQQLVDCDKAQAGCNGASTLTEPVEWSVKNGLCRESDYKYVARNEKCATEEKCNGVLYKAADWFDLSGKSADDVIAALEEYGALSVGVGVGFAFQMYRGGVMTKASCGRTNPNHAVTLVGYEMVENTKEDGTVESFPAFKIRNSWGEQWGEEGNIRLEWGACMLGSMVVGVEAGELPTVPENNADADESSDRVSFFRF